MRRNETVERLLSALAMVMLVAGCATSDGAGRAASSSSKAGGIPRGSAGGNALVASNGQAVRCVDEPVTGSHLPKRVCRTEAEWRNIEQQSKELGRTLQGPIYGPKEAAAAGTPPL
jgi:predicted small secreted protein